MKDPRTENKPENKLQLISSHLIKMGPKLFGGESCGFPPCLNTMEGKTLSLTDTPESESGWLLGHRLEMNRACSQGTEVY